MKFKNIKNRVISVLLATTLLIGTNNITLQAASSDPENSHGVAMNPANKIDEFKDDVGGALVPQVQLLRVTLMKTVTVKDDGTTDHTQGGQPVTKAELPELKHNIIHMVPKGAETNWKTFKSDLILNNIRTPKNIDPNRVEGKHLSMSNSRREYLLGDGGTGGPNASFILSYGAYWKDKNSDGTPMRVPQWVFTDTKYQTWQLSRVFEDPCVGYAVPSILPNGDKEKYKAEYHKNPPAGTNISSTMEPNEYLKEISRAVFLDTDYGADTAKQAFIYHIIADMIGKSSTPYCEEVEKIVTEKIMSRQFEILVEPTITFDVRKSHDLKAMFGDIMYISLTAGDLKTEDGISTVFWGASGLASMYNDKDSTRPRGFNPIIHGQSSSSFMYNFYESLMLEAKDEAVQLYSVDCTDYYRTAYDKSIINADDNDGKTIGPLYDGKKGAFYTSAFYDSTFYRNNGEGLNTGDAVPTGVTCQVDLASMLHTGAMYILPITYSRIDFKADSLVPSSDPQATTPATPIRTLKTQTKGECPVYPRDVIYQDENGNNFVNIKAISKLNFDDNATSWLDKVTQNKASLLQSTSEDVKLLDNTFDLSQPIYIPARTKTLVHLHYANEQGQGGETIQIDYNNDDSKLYIENNHLFGYFQNNDTASKAVDILSSSANHGKPTQDNKDLHGEIPVGHNIPVNDMTGVPIIQDIGDEGYVKVYLPKNIDTTQKYLQVTLDVNMGKYSDGSFSRPQKTNEGNKYAVLTVPNGEPEVICDCVEENFDNNSLTILIKLDNSLDLSADSITRGSSPIITKDPIKVSQCNISTTATANEGAIKSYPNSTVTQTLYYYFSNTNTNEFQNVYNTATDNIDWTNPNVLTELVTKYDAGLPTVNGKKITQTTHTKPTSNIDPMDIENWNECSVSPEVDPNQTIYLHLALVVNPDNNIPNEETYKNNIVFKTYPYDIPDDPPPPPSSPALSCYVPTGSSTGLPLRILNNSTPTNYITGILNSKILEANNDPNKVEGSLDSHYGAKIRVNDVPNTKPTGYRPDPQYEEIDSIVVGRCNGENEQEEPDDTPEWVFYDEDDLIFHEIAFKYLSYDPVKRRYYVATQILPYTKRVIEHTPCDCEDGCSSPTVTYHYYRLCDTQTVDYTLIFDDLYSADSNVSSAYSLQSLLNQESEKGRYFYFAEAGSPVGLTMRTRLISDFPDFSNFSDTGDKSTGAGVPLGGIVQLADSKGLFNSNNNIKATLELTGFEYVKHILNDYNNTTGPSKRAGAVDKSNDYYSNILLTSPDFTSNFTDDFIANPTTLDTSPELDRDDDALYGANLDGTNPNGTWQYTTYPLENTFTTDYISTRYYRFDISEQPIVLGGGNGGTPKNVGKQRGVVTDKDYSDGIKVNKYGIGQINNDYIKSKRLYKNRQESSANSVADAIDRYSYRYCSQRLKPIVWTQEIYLPTGLNFYNYTTQDGSSLENSHQSLIGLCSDYNILINGTVADNYTLH